MSLVEDKVDGGARKVATVHTMRIKVANSSIYSDKTRLEMDSHADTTVLGKGCLVVYDFDRPVNVTEYDPEEGSKCFRNLTGVLDYDHHQTGNPYFLVINQSKHLDRLGNHLMCTIQFSKNRIRIKNTTKYHSKSPDESKQVLQVKYPSDE